MGKTNRLWLLCPISRLPNNDDPWKPWYDKAFGFVVRAETEEAARQLAHVNAGDENHCGLAPWQNARYSTCVELPSDGPTETVLRSFRSA